MKPSSGHWLGIFLGAILFIAISYGGWRLERWFHYKFSYQSQVQDEIKPLVQRLNALEQRVSVLETNNNQR